MSYRTGLAQLPSRKETGKEKEKAEGLVQSSDEEEDTTVRSQEPEAHETTFQEDVLHISEVQAECAKARAILNANIAACHVKLVCIFQSISSHNI